MEIHPNASLVYGRIGRSRAILGDYHTQEGLFHSETTNYTDIRVFEPVENPKTSETEAGRQSSGGERSPHIAHRTSEGYRIT